MFIRSLVDFIQDEETKRNFENFFIGKEKGAVDSGIFESVDPSSLANRIASCDDERLKKLLLFYISNKKFMGERLFDACFCALDNESYKKQFLYFRQNELSKIQEEYDSFCVEKYKNRKNATINEFKNSLTNDAINDIFDESKMASYEILGDFMKANNLDSLKINALKEVLSTMNKIKELERLEALEEQSKANSAKSFCIINKKVENVGKFIINGVKTENGVTKPYTLLEYLLNYKDLSIPTFMDVLRKSDFSGKDKATIKKFFNPMNNYPYKKEKLFEGTIIFGEHEVTLEEKEKAYKLLVDNNIKTTYFLFKQALKTVI